MSKAVILLLAALVSASTACSQQKPYMRIMDLEVFSDTAAHPVLEVSARGTVSLRDDRSGKLLAYTDHNDRIVIARNATKPEIDAALIRSLVALNNNTLSVQYSRALIMLPKFAAASAEKFSPWSAK